MNIRTILLFACLCAFSSAFAQTQQGLVKTKGRLSSNGNVIKGTPLAGATVTVRGRNAVLSGTSGTFSLPIPSNTFYLQNVQKQGYVLTDPDVLSKQYAYSKNPLTLVLETPAEQADDKLAAERKIRRTLQRQLQQKEDEIEDLKQQKKISEEEYRQQLQEIYAQQESNEKLISEMANRYSRMDFDEVDEFNRRISSLILDGRLTEADSLLNTKGDINTRATVLRQHQEANAQTEQEIKKKQKKLEKSKAMTQKELEDLAQDCYSKFEIFKMQHQNDSAAHYIKLRAELDTTNVEWKCVAGMFIQDYIADYDLSLSFFNDGLHKATQMNDTNLIAGCLNNIGAYYFLKADLDNAMESFMKALNLYKNYSKPQYSNYIEIYNNIGLVYKERDQLDDAKHYYDIALETALQTEDNNYQTSSIYNNIGYIHYAKANYKDALSCFEKALSLGEAICGEDHPLVATSYNNIASTYKFLGDSVKAFDAYQKSLDIRKRLYGEQHPEVALSYNNMGSLYMYTHNFDKAIEYLNKATSIRKKILGNRHPDVAISLNNLGGAYLQKKNYDKALEFFYESLSIRKLSYGNESSAVATSLENIGGISFFQGNYDKALELFEQSLSIRKKILKGDHPQIASGYKCEADVYYAKGEYKKALELYNAAYSVFQNVFPDTHKIIVEVRGKIEETNKKLQQ